MAGRPKGTRNKEHTNRQGQLTLSVDVAILAEWREFCNELGITMSSRFEQLMRQDTQQIDGAFGIVVSDQEYRDNLAAKEAMEREAE